METNASSIWSRHLRLLGAALTLFALPALTARGGAMYSVTELQPLAGQNGAFPVAMSRNGLIAVESGVYGASRNFYVYDRGQITVLPDSVDRIQGMNSSGVVTTNYGGINDLGQTSSADQNSHILIHSAGGAIDIGKPAGVENVNPRVINNAGQVAGYGFSSGDGFIDHPFVTVAGRPTLLDVDNAAVYALNDAGQAVGGNLNGPGRPFLYDHGKITYLAPAGVAGRGMGINDLGQIVGTFDIDPSYHEHAFLYQNGVLTDLNKLILPSSGYTLVGAMGIDDSGRIIAYSDDGGTTHALLLTPVPEPTSLLVFGAGSLMAGLAFHRKHKVKTTAPESRSVKGRREFSGVLRRPAASEARFQV